jgi:putative membrane protein (TIGR04086 family)
MKPIPQVTGFRIASPLVSGLLWSIIWLAAGTLALSLLLYGTSMEEKDAVPWVFGIHGFSSLCGGFVSGRRSGRKGWSIGMVAGLLYAALVLLTSFLAHDIGWSSRIPLMVGATGFAGALGGMLGVNAGSSRSGKRK